MLSVLLGILPALGGLSKLFTELPHVVTKPKEITHEHKVRSKGLPHPMDLAQLWFILIIKLCRGFFFHPQ